MFCIFYFIFFHLFSQSFSHIFMLYKKRNHTDFNSSNESNISQNTKKEKSIFVLDIILWIAKFFFWKIFFKIKFDSHTHTKKCLDERSLCALIARPYNLIFDFFLRTLVSPYTSKCKSSFKLVVRR